MTGPDQQEVGAVEMGQGAGDLEATLAGRVVILAPAGPEEQGIDTLKTMDRPSSGVATSY